MSSFFFFVFPIPCSSFLAVCCQNIFGKCSGNQQTAADLATPSVPAGTFGYACGAGFHYKAHGEGILRPGGGPANDKAACCAADVVGKCSGNTATATNLAEASTPAGTFQYACGATHKLKAAAMTIALSGADAAARTAICCDAIVSGKCGGNTATATDLAQASTPAGTFQYACPTSYKLKTTPAAITGKTTALCCDATAGMCAGNSVTATGLEPHGTRRLGAHLAGTFDFKCAVGKQLKTGADMITGATDVLCCDKIPAGSTTEGDFVAFEPTYVIPDKSKREKEVFTTVDKTQAYKIALKRNNKVVGSRRLASHATKIAVAMTKMTLTGAGVSNTYTFQSVIMKTVPKQDLAYNWYVARSSNSGPSAITCNNPNYKDYPGTRFNGGTTCPAWCAKKGGTWTDGSKCYADKTTSKKATGCCIVPAKDYYWGLKQVSFAADCSSKTSCKIPANSPSVGGAMNALTAFKTTPYTSANLDEMKVSFFLFIFFHEIF